MRWYWIDRFLEFESGRACKSVKNVSLAEEHLHDHFPGHPVMPGSLIIEGFAQAGGILVGEHLKLQGNMILAKVPRATFHFAARPGDTLVYESVIEYAREDGALVVGKGYVGDRLQSEVDVFFANVSESENARMLFGPAELLSMMKLLGAYEVGRTADGDPLEVPPELRNGQPLPDPVALSGRS